MNNDFWHTPLGPVTGNKEDISTKTFTTIPDNTKALASIHAFQTKQYNGVDYYEIDWLLENPYGGRHVFHKIQVNHFDPKKQHKAKTLLKYLFNMFKISLPQYAPAPHDLTKFLNKKAVIIIRETSPNENGKVYNWVAEVLEATQQNFHSTPIQNNYNKSPPPMHAPMPKGEVEEWDVPF